MNLISQQDDIDKIYLYAEALSEPKYQFLIKKCEDAGITPFNDPKAFIECSGTMDDLFENIDDDNPNRVRKILIVFDDTIADIITNKKFQAVVKELFIRCRKLNIALAFITQSYFAVPKDVTLKSTCYLIMKINNKKIYRECTKELYSFFTIDKTLPASDPFKFRKNLFLFYENDSD